MGKQCLVQQSKHASQQFAEEKSVLPEEHQYT